MGEQDNKLEERGLPRDSCLLSKCPQFIFNPGLWGEQDNKLEKRGLPRDSCLLSKCPQIEYQINIFIIYFINTNFTIFIVIV